MSVLLSPYALPLLLMLAAGLCAGFAAGLFGIGGGFVVVPVLFWILPLLGGNTTTLAHSAIGTSLATIVVTSLRSVQAHARRGAVDFDILQGWAPWIVLGVGGGIFLADRISSPALLIIFGTGVLLMAIHFLVPFFAGRQLRSDMPGRLATVGIGSGLGAFSSLLGIGGGTIAIIVMTLCGKSIHHAIGTAAGCGILIALPGMIGFMLIGQNEAALPWGSVGYVNLPAAIAIVATSTFSAGWGAAAAHRLSSALLARIFGFYLLMIGGLMLHRGLAG